MLELSDRLIIGTGGQRICYAHPDERDLCIKIPFETKLAQAMQRAEIDYLKTPAAKTCEHLAQYHGSVETTEGLGYLYDLVRDGSGDVSPPITHFLKKSPDRSSEICEELGEVYRSMRSLRLRVHDLNGSNILCQTGLDGSIALKLIDGIGDPSFLAPLKSFGPLHGISLRRRFERLVRRVERKIGQPGLGLTFR